MALSVKEITEYAGISASSIRIWGKELADVLSNGANPPKGATRRYTHDDAVIFHTAKILKSEGESWGKIIDAIKQGERIMPASDHTQETENIQANNDVIPLSFFERIVKTLSSERDNLRQDLESEKRKHEKTINNLLEVTERATKAETRAEMLQYQLDELVQKDMESLTEGEQPKRWWQRLFGGQQ